MLVPNLNNNKKISRSIGIMYKQWPFVNVSIMKSVDYSIIYPHLIYGLQVWGSAFKTAHEKMNILQKKGVRMITFNDSFPSQGYCLCHSLPLFLKVEFLKILDIYKFQISKFIWKQTLSYYLVIVIVYSAQKDLKKLQTMKFTYW